MLTYHSFKLDNPSITSELDHLIGNLASESMNCDFSDYREDLSANHGRKRVTEATLLQLAGTDRNVAAYDENVIRLPKYFATELAEDFENILRAFVLPRGDYKFNMTGKFWYPPGGYMGWHTNGVFPGYRMYISKALQAGHSFFRYKDPRNGHIKTCDDALTWTGRIFHIDPVNPFWHCVYSDTDRFSFGCNLFLT